ncbi:MAG: glycosyltransferase family 9 protein [Desulfosudaceae bacterium]
MNITTQRRIDRILGTLICRVLSLLPQGKASGGKKAAPGQVHRILVILLSEMGSLTMAWPMVRRLKEKYPGAALEVLTFARNREIIDLMELFPAGQVHVVRDDSLIRFIRDSLNFALAIRHRRPDIVVDCELFSRISSIYSFFSGAPVKTGFYRYTQEGLYRGDFINRPVLYNPYLHITRQFLNLAEAVDAANRPQCKRLVENGHPALPSVSISSREREAMTRRIEADLPVLDIRQRPLVVLHPGGGLLPIRAWPVQYYARVARTLTEAGYSIAVTGTPADRPLAETISEACAGSFCADMTGFTASVHELLLVFAGARLLITNDGGPGHFAGLVSLPSIILYGPETPVLYGSLNEKAVNLFANCACSPCLTAYNHRHSPCDGDNLCLRAIYPETVISTALSLLGRDKENRQ